MTFLAPWFLLGGILTLLPIIIHLWFKKRLRKVPFSSLTFLKITEAKRFGWLRLREILTLISRCCFIACLVLSIARPRLQSSIFKTSRTASVVLLFDNSYSMLYQDNIACAKDKAYEIIDRYTPQSQYMILPMCGPAADSTPQVFWTNKSSAVNIIESIEPTYRSGSVYNIFASAELSGSRHSVDRIYIGDGQMVSFTDYPDTMPPLYWVAVPANDNCGITNVSLADPIALPEESYEMTIMIHNHGVTPWDGHITIQELKPPPEISCSIPPRDKQRISITLPRMIDHGTIVLKYDSLPPDNTYYFAKHVPREIKVLIVGENRFLSNALHSNGIVLTPFNVTIVHQLHSADARQYDVIIICGNKTLTPVDRTMLEHIIDQQTASILFLLGTNVNDQMTELLAPYCNINDFIDPAGYVTLEWIDYAHPVFNIFRDDPTLETVKVSRYWALASKVNVRVRLSDDRPFIISKGNVTIIPTSFTPASTDLVYKTAFIPLLYRLLMIGMETEYDLEHYVGGTNTLGVPVQSPVGEYVPPGGEFSLPGHYTAGDTILAVNILPEEGDLTPLNKETARILQIIPVESSDLTGKDLSLFFLICALAFILFEVILLLIR